MSKSESVTIGLQMDTVEVESGLSDIAAVLESVGQLVEALGASISKVFGSFVNSVQNASTQISGMDTALNDISSTMEELVASQQSGGGLFDGFLSGIERLTSISATIDDLEAISTKYDALTDAVEKYTKAQVSGSRGQGALSDIFASVLPETTDEVMDFFEDFGEGLQGIFGGISTIFSGMSMGWGLAVGAIVAAIAILIANWDKIKAAIMPLWETHLKPLWDGICAFFSSVGTSLMTLWETVLLPIIDWVRQVLEPFVLTVMNVIAGAFTAVLGTVADVIRGIISVLDGIIQFIAGAFAGDWEMAWEGIAKIFQGLIEAVGGVFKGVINVIIMALNVLIGAIYSTIAAVVNGLSSVVGTIGNIVGQDWDFSVPTDPPQIPYLAQGAVLPANRPFLAVVGDQKHGTNVEAPLETIQEAVALVMGDVVASNMAGHEATVGVLREILGAVMGIEIGDEVIGRAARRYDARMAVVRGGR